ncbi:2TM domain-containing protein [Arenibacter sp. BSSL-BM3]|uniref:2TM domain-containing protein n=2 Tax=Arenibacter arenosicollis TaxID=2762274 RepID=A0ABR7QLW4_9FLAO|nr:2TM domain-containing protein [Arenibacter arenosicollis]
MEIMDYDKKKKMLRAKKHVGELRGFYIHLTVYLAVNLMITTVKIIGSMSYGESFLEALWDFGAFAVWLFWGIGLVFHGLKVFSYNPFFNKDWEERQIRKYMEKEKKDSERYR